MYADELLASKQLLPCWDRERGRDDREQDRRNNEAMKTEVFTGVSGNDHPG